MFILVQQDCHLGKKHLGVSQQCSCRFKSSETGTMSSGNVSLAFHSSLLSPLSQ